jgi:predicted metal-binding protein
MTEKEILAEAREKILKHAGGDPDKWWYANRFVFARLQLDEHKTKTAIKRKLLVADTPCHGCGKRFDPKRDIHLHRLDGDKGYNDANCVLMHPECHRRVSASRRKEVEKPSGREPTVVKWSKRYDDKPFRYWWDIAPPLAECLDNLEAVEFAKKDARERCIVPVQALKGFLAQERQTTRGQGNWGVKVLRNREDELAFEPGARGGEWLFLPVVWLDEAED